jgi:ParB-like chromosome segregation protein Spo0J
MDKSVVAEYAERLEAGDELPAVVVFYDGTTYWLAEGFHRLAAHKKAGNKQTNCILIEGTKADAQWHALQSNKTHGLRRSIEDKKRAVEMALEHPKGRNFSDRGIAELVGVSATMVAKYRKEAKPTAKDGQSTKRVGRDGRTINTAKIGRSKKAKPARSEAEKAETAEPKASAAQDQCPHGGNHEPDEDGDCLKCREPGVGKPMAPPEHDSDETDVEPNECSVELVSDIAEFVGSLQEAMDTIQGSKELAALSEDHRLLLLVRQVETAVEGLRDWLASLSEEFDHITASYANDSDDLEEPEQDADEGDELTKDAEEVAEWTA